VCWRSAQLPKGIYVVTCSSNLNKLSSTHTGLNCITITCLLGSFLISRVSLESFSCSSPSQGFKFVSEGVTVRYLLMWENSVSVLFSKLGHLVRQCWMEFVPAVTEAVNNICVTTCLMGFHCTITSLSEYRIPH